MWNLGEWISVQASCFWSYLPGLASGIKILVKRLCWTKDNIALHFALCKNSTTINNLKWGIVTKLILITISIKITIMATMFSLSKLKIKVIRNWTFKSAILFPSRFWAHKPSASFYRNNSKQFLFFIKWQELKEEVKVYPPALILVTQPSKICVLIEKMQGKKKDITYMHEQREAKWSIVPLSIPVCLVTLNLATDKNVTDLPAENYFWQ